MFRLVWGLFILIALSFSAYAGLYLEGDDYFDQPLQEYFEADKNNYNKSIIYIFYNGNQCFQCPQTIELTEEIYNQYYADRYSLFVIDYTADNGYDFAAKYQLNAPLTIVLLRIEDGESLGYRKINNPQNFIDTPEEFFRYLTEQINNFLGQ